jgi:hypothetical protein
MPKRVTVTKITVEYAFEGKTFTVVFGDPARIESLVFSQEEFDRLRARQNELAALRPSEVKAVREHVLSPNEPFPRQASDGERLFATSTQTGSADTVGATTSRSLWWHTSSCAWFHPELL